MTEELTPEQVAAYKRMQIENWNFCDYIPPTKEEKPKSEARKRWEERVRALHGRKQHLRLVKEMQHRYESIIVTEETCLRFKEGRCNKKHPHPLVFYHPLIQGPDYLEKWKNDE